MPGATDTICILGHYSNIIVCFGLVQSNLCGWNAIIWRSA